MQLHSGLRALRTFLEPAGRIAGWLLAGTITILSVVPPTLRPETALPHSIEHFGIFAATGFAFVVGYYRRPVFVTAALVIFAGVVELAQLFVSGRHARLSDFLVDALASLVGGAAGYLATNGVPTVRPILPSEGGGCQARRDLGTVRQLTMTAQSHAPSKELENFRNITDR